jgi:outer membrane autotransporter protein
VLSGSTKLAGNAVVSAGSLLLGDAQRNLSGVKTLVVGDKNSTAALLDVGTSGATLTGGQTLKGVGTVSGILKLARSSTLAPGNSVGTQSLQGRLEFEKGAFFEAEVRMLAGILESDRYQVTGPRVDEKGNTVAGSIQISGGTVVAVQEIERSVGAQKGTGLSTGRVTDFKPLAFTILSSTVGAVIAGTFDSVVSGVVWKSHLEYIDDGGVVATAPGPGTLSEQVRLVLQRVPYRMLGATGTRAEVGRALDLSLATRDPLLWNLLDILDGAQTSEQVRAILDQLNPRVFTEVYSLGLSRLQDIQKVASDRLMLLGAAMLARGDSALGEIAGDTHHEWTVWTGAYGSWNTRDADSRGGEGAVSRSSQGNATGVERRFGALTLGVMGILGTAQSQMRQPGASLTSESWHLGMYLSAPVRERVFVDGLAFVGAAENTLTRTQTLPRTDEFGTPTLVNLPGRTRLTSQEWLAQLGLGVQVAPPESRWMLVPSLRVAYAGVHQNKARESGAGSLGVATDSKTYGTVLTRTGIDLAVEGHLGRLPFRVTSSAAWVHDFATHPRRLEVRWQGVDSVPWSVSGAPQSTDLLRLGFALECGLGDRRSLRLFGEQEFLDSRRTLRGGATFTVHF